MRRLLPILITSLLLFSGLETAAPPPAGTPAGAASIDATDAATTAGRYVPFGAGFTEYDWFLFRLWTDPAFRLQWTAYVIATWPVTDCGGNLPPCYVAERESHFDIRAENPTSSASGKWQFLSSTWRAYALPWVVALHPTAGSAGVYWQDDAARRAWNGGAGCFHWSAC